MSGDGVSDLVLSFRTQDSGIALGDAQACVRGELYDATPIEGCDEVAMVPSCGLGFELALLLPPLMAAYGRRRRVVPFPGPRVTRG